MSELSGVDLSHWNTQVDMAAAAAAGCSFVILKATEGATYVDPTYTDRDAAATAAGVLAGAYHFASGGNPGAEASHFAATVAGQARLLALDFEGQILKHADPVGWAAQWLEAVRAQTGILPLVYMSRSTIGRFDWTPVVKMNAGLWVASWAPTPPESVAPWPFWAIWQHASDATVAGIAGRVDADVFNGDAAAWQKYATPAAHNPPPPPAPEPAPSPAPAPTPAPAPAPAPQPAPAAYTVVSGDTLSSIAAAHGTTWRQLVAWNRGRYPQLTGNPNMIRIGWRLQVGPGTPAAHGLTYTIKSGDTLSEIAAAHGTTWRELVTLNRGRYPTLAADPGTIQPGWVLNLP